MALSNGNGRRKEGTVEPNIAEAFSPDALMARLDAYAAHRGLALENNRGEAFLNAEKVHTRSQVLTDADQGLTMTRTEIYRPIYTHKEGSTRPNSEIVITRSTPQGELTVRAATSLHTTKKEVAEEVFELGETKKKDVAKFTDRPVTTYTLESGDRVFQFDPTSNDPLDRLHTQFAFKLLPQVV